MTAMGIDSESQWTDSYQLDEHELELVRDLSSVDDPFVIACHLTERRDSLSQAGRFRLLRWFHPVRADRLVKKREKAEAAYHSLPPGVRIQIGREAVARQGARWLAKHRGKFIAITLRGQILAICDTLAQVYEVLGYSRPQEDYYVTRLGYPSVGTLI